MLNKLLMRTTLLAVAASSSLAHADGGFEVTVTNLTRGQQFTPILVATHREGVQLFTAGDPASTELAVLAEEGDTAPLTTLLSGLPEVKEVVSSIGLLSPGDSVTISVETGGPFNVWRPC